MSQSLKEYEGTWEEILSHSDELTGQTVHLTIVEPKKELPLANQKMLALLDDWKNNPLPPEEMQILDEFEEFQRQQRDRFYSTENAS